MRWPQEFLVSHVRQRIFTKYTFEASFRIGSLYEKLFITTDVNSSKYEMRLRKINEKLEKNYYRIGDNDLKWLLQQYCTENR